MTLFSEHPLFWTLWLLFGAGSVGIFMYDAVTDLRKLPTFSMLLVGAGLTCILLASGHLSFWGLVLLSPHQEHPS